MWSYRSDRKLQTGNVESRAREQDGEMAVADQKFKASNQEEK